MLKLSTPKAFLTSVRYASFNYKTLPEESKVLIDKILRVDHAGKPRSLNWIFLV
jgi:hypothetical protein